GQAARWPAFRSQQRAGQERRLPLPSVVQSRRGSRPRLAQFSRESSFRRKRFRALGKKRYERVCSDAASCGGEISCCPTDQAFDCHASLRDEMPRLKSNNDSSLQGKYCPSFRSGPITL